MIDIWLFLTHLGLAVVLAEFDGLVTFTHVVIEGADVELIASMLITHDSLVLVWMVEALDGRMALAAFESFWTHIPSDAIDESFTVLWGVLEDVWRSSEVSSVMGEIASFRIMGVFLGRAPTCLVVEHEEDVALLFVVQVSEVLVQRIEFQKTRRHEVIFDAFVLEVAVDGLDILQIFQRKWRQLVRLLVLVESHN